MFEVRGNRSFFSAPQSVTTVVAALMEPAISVLIYLVAMRWSDETIMRADMTLCLLVVTLSFPGRNRFRDTLINATVDIVVSWITLLLVLALFGYATRSWSLFEPDVLVFWALASPVAQIAAVRIGQLAVRREATSTRSRRTAVVIGAGAVGVKVARALTRSVYQGINFVGYFDDRNDIRVHADASPKRLGGLREAAPYILDHGIHEVFITLPLSSQPRIIELMEDLQGTTASVYLVPDVFGISIIQGRLRDMNGVPVVGICETPFTGVNRLSKRASDIALASILLVLISPVMLATYVGVKLSSPGPAIFKQRRNGLGGEEIVIYKFRSMRVMDDGAVVKQAVIGDPRITRFGAFIRRTSLDELPQFINVLQGRMSIVGPRPHAVAHNEQYRKLVKAYMVRHKVKPGITGWAQVQGHRGETDTIEKMQARIEYDLEYLRNWSLVLDLKIIARTVKVAFLDRNAH